MPLNGRCKSLKSQAWFLAENKELWRNFLDKIVFQGILGVGGATGTSAPGYAHDVLTEHLLLLLTTAATAQQLTVSSKNAHKIT